MFHGTRGRERQEWLKKMAADVVADLRDSSTRWSKERAGYVISSSGSQAAASGH